MLTDQEKLAKAKEQELANLKKLKQTSAGASSELVDTSVGTKTNGQNGNGAHLKKNIISNLGGKELPKEVPQFDATIADFGNTAKKAEPEIVTNLGGKELPKDVPQFNPNAESPTHVDEWGHSGKPSPSGGKKGGVGGEFAKSAERAKARGDVAAEAFKEAADKASKGEKITEATYNAMGTGFKGMLNKGGAMIRANFHVRDTNKFRDIAMVGGRGISTFAGGAAILHGGLKVFKGLTGGEKIDKETGKSTQMGMGDAAFGLVEIGVGAGLGYLGLFHGGKGNLGLSK